MDDTVGHLEHSWKSTKIQIKSFHIIQRFKLFKYADSLHFQEINLVTRIAENIFLKKKISGSS